MTKYSAVCCYFGKWPSHFQFWLDSCRYNRNITFFLVSDIPTDEFRLPENVCVIRMSFPELHDLISTKFSEIKISLDRPYKLCDFKTAYGYIFDEYCKEYEYWGYYDIDTIWGNIEKFIPANEDNHLVKIFPCGHLSFIKNVVPWNKVFELVNKIAGTPCRNNMEGKTVATWQECFSSPESHYYDEEGGLEPLFASLKENICGGVDFDNILPPWRFDHFFSINFPEKSHFLVYGFKKGTLSRYFLKNWKVISEEISYLHTSKRHYTVKTDNTDNYSIAPNTIVSEKKWNLITLLIYGRPRYLKNLLRRVISRIKKLN